MPVHVPSLSRCTQQDYSAAAVLAGALQPEDLGRILRKSEALTSPNPPDVTHRHVKDCVELIEVVRGNMAGDWIDLIVARDTRGPEIAGVLSRIDRKTNREHEAEWHPRT